MDAEESRARTKLLAQNDQEIESALEITLRNIGATTAAIMLAESYKAHPREDIRYLGLLMSIGYNAIAESHYQRRLAKESGDG